MLLLLEEERLKGQLGSKWIYRLEGNEQVGLKKKGGQRHWQTLVSLGISLGDRIMRQEWWQSIKTVEVKRMEMHENGELAHTRNGERVKRGPFLQATFSN